MRLINTETLELRNFISNIPAYAILSHRWRQGPDEEATLQQFDAFQRARRGPAEPLADIETLDLAQAHMRIARLEQQLEALLDHLQNLSSSEHGARKSYVTERKIDGPQILDSDRIRARTESKSASQHTKPGIQKVLDFCRKAREDGYEWGWADTVCVDKTNHAELTETINSMYKWYQDASICFVHLYDVSSDQQVHKALHASDWFTRGWTLQELIAPKKVVFYDSSWSELGTRETLQRGLSEITNIPTRVLNDPEEVLYCTSAQRMSWAATRETTRAEDMSYCLLGLFNVHMELLYGEGAENAFRRLQMKCLETADDESLLAWEPLEDDLYPHGEIRIAGSKQRAGENCAFTGILASRPQQFRGAGNVDVSDRVNRKGPIKISSWGLEMSREVREISELSVLWHKRKTQAQDETSERSTSSIILIPLSYGFADSKGRGFIAIARDTTPKTMNRWCRVHSLELSAEQSMKRFLDMNSKKYEKHIFVRVSWPKSLPLLEGGASQTGAWIVVDVKLKGRPLRVYVPPRRYAQEFDRRPARAYGRPPRADRHSIRKSV